MLHGIFIYVLIWSLFLNFQIRNSHLENTHMVGFERQRREYAGFSHNDLKYVELRGCVFTINAIELASHILRNANSLKQITFTSCEKFFRGAGRWIEGTDGCCWFDRGLIHEMLQDEVNERLTSYLSNKKDLHV